MDKKTYRTSGQLLSRTERNQSIYKTATNSDNNYKYENLENTNEINLEDLKKILQKRENHRVIKEYDKIISTDEEVETLIIDEQIEHRDFNIHNIIQKAKENRNTVDANDKYRKLKNTQYDILSKLNIKRTNNYDEDELTSEKLRELIDTITSGNGVIETNCGDQTNDELSLDILSDLKDEGESKENTELPVEIAKRVEANTKTSEKDFFTSAFTFSTKDFEGNQNIKAVVKFNNILIKLLFGVLFVILAAITAFLIVNYL